MSLRRTMTLKPLVTVPPCWLLLMSSQVSLMCFWKGQRFLIIWARTRCSSIAVWDSECIETMVLFQELHHCVVCSCVDHKNLDIKLWIQSMWQSNFYFFFKLWNGLWWVFVIYKGVIGMTWYCNYWYIFITLFREYCGCQDFYNNDQLHCNSEKEADWMLTFSALFLFK